MSTGISKFCIEIVVYILLAGCLHLCKRDVPRYHRRHSEAVGGSPPLYESVSSSPPTARQRQ
jgi:hypothetical protein